MENSGIIIWKDETIGTVTNIILDMWYMDADWIPNNSETTLKFEELASKLKDNEVIKEPSNGIVALLKYNEAPSNSHSVLILSIDNSKIFMRSISDEVASYADKKLLQPWQPVDNPAFYESELKKIVSFFHPLNWKNVRAIANRTDCDEVLFEVLNGRFKYAVVHLTWKKENSRKFPTTKFYKDWQDIYTNRLWEDHKKWELNFNS
jgi:thiol-disulfide isomerase/thioredoxin